SGLKHGIEVVKNGEKKFNWQIAAITGATISSKAVGRILNEAASRHIPVIRRNLKTMIQVGGDGD
ncbi:MAG: FMN-binding protein, partial [Candidatus Dadabacteria bacterium]